MSLKIQKEAAALNSLGISIALVTLKALAAWFSGSFALLSDVMHGLLDISLTSVSYWAVRASHKPADEKHHYGHDKIESVVALIGTFFLFILACIIGAVSLRAFFSSTSLPTPTLSPFIAGVLLFSLGVDGWRYWLLKRVAQETQSRCLQVDSLHFASDALSVVLVFLGLIGASLGLPSSDILAALAIAVLIGILSINLARESIADLIDTAPEGLQEALMKDLSQLKGIEEISSVRLRTAGLQTFGDMTLVVPDTLTTSATNAVAERVREHLAQAWPHVNMYITLHYKHLTYRTIAERMEHIAMRYGVNVHHIIAQQKEGRLIISCDIEMRGEWTLGAAHDVATGFENSVRDEFGVETDVETHIEPTYHMPLESQDADPEEWARIEATLQKEASKVGHFYDVHNVHVQKTSLGSMVQFHCHVAPETPLAIVHAWVDALECSVRQACPEIGRIVGHAEPLISISSAS
jgi:cation diffusion facilitator family transporter